MIGSIFVSSILFFFFGILSHVFLFPQPSPIIFPLFLSLIVLPFFFIQNRVLKIIAYAVVFFSLGFVRFDMSLSQHYEAKQFYQAFLNSQQDLHLDGYVVTRPVRGRWGKIRFAFMPEKISLSDRGDFSIEKTLPKYRLLVTGKESLSDKIRYGDRLHLRGNLREIENFESDHGRVFDYRHYLEKDRVLFIVDAHDIQIQGEKQSLTSLLYSLKDFFLERIYSLLPREEASLLSGILLGEKRDLSPELENAFRRTGLMHIVVLSGYNVSIVIIAMMLLLSWVPEKMRFLLLALGIFAFTILVGAGPTVVRAALMASLLLISRLLGKAQIAERVLLLVAFLMVLYNPWILPYDISFQLSFLATYGLIEWMPFFERKLAWFTNILEMRESLSATLSAQLMVAPLIAYSMGTFSLISPIVNMLVLFIIPIAMLFGFLLVILSPFPLFLKILTPLSYYSLKYIISLVSFFSSFRFAELSFGRFSWIWLILTYTFIVFLIFLKRKNQRVNNFVL